MDVKETDTAYEFDVDIPGLTKDEVQVSCSCVLLWCAVPHACC